MRAARLKELEEMAAKLLETARKLPSGQDRHNALPGILPNGKCMPLISKPRCSGAE
jgi:hypothetical protein